MPGFYPSWVVACAECGGLSMTEDDFYGYAGWPLPEIVRDLYVKKHAAAPDEAYVQKFLSVKLDAHHRFEAERGCPAVIAPTAALARAYVARGVPVVAATSGLREHVERHLAAADLLDLFPPERIVCAADLPPGRGKPHPDIFQRAAALVGADPRRCVAYEDAEAGFEAAFRAGCEVVDVRDLGGYPLPRGLQVAMQDQRKARTFDKGQDDGPSAS